MCHSLHSQLLTSGGDGQAVSLVDGGVYSYSAFCGTHSMRRDLTPWKSSNSAWNKVGIVVSCPQLVLEELKVIVDSSCTLTLCLFMEHVGDGFSGQIHVRLPARLHGPFLPRSRYFVTNQSSSSQRIRKLFDARLLDIP